jgi:hypothetical protein
MPLQRAKFLEKNKKTSNHMQQHLIRNQSQIETGNQNEQQSKTVKAIRRNPQKLDRPPITTTENTEAGTMRKPTAKPGLSCPRV